MKILYFNGSDIEGGASRAAMRLLQGVHARGVDARLHVQRKFGQDPLVDGPRTTLGKALGFARPTIEQLLFGINRGKMNGPFCAAFLPDGLVAQASDTVPDIIHLHWVARMMRLETLARFNVPLVWTMHDSWAFTGGCYLPGDCTRYRDACGECPVLGSAGEDDLSRRVWQRKQKAWHDLNLTIIAPSRWMAACARSSSLFREKRIEVIPNGIDVQRYKTFDRLAARERFSLPRDKKLILFGAKSATQDRNKGFHLLKEALRKLADTTQPDMIELVIFGSADSSQLMDLSFAAHSLGLFDDDATLAQLYAAADVFVLPSLQENLPYTVMEAMACGTPCVAFKQGGVSDLIDHGENGYLVRPYEICDLAQGIDWVLGNDDRTGILSELSRRKVVQEFALDRVAERHAELYRALLQASSQK